MVTWPWTNYIAFCLRQKLYHAITSKERQSVSLCSESRRRVLNLPGCPTISANVACSITSREWQAREHTGARPSICCIVKLPTSLIPGYLTTARTRTPLISRFEESYSSRRGLTVSTNSTSDWLSVVEVWTAAELCQHCREQVEQALSPRWRKNDMSPVDGHFGHFR